MNPPRSPNQIVTAATGLFRRFGLKRTSMNQIAEAANVSRGTLYSHFQNKEEVFIAVAQDICSQIIEETRRAKTDHQDLEERLIGMLAAKFTKLFNTMVLTPHYLELIEAQAQICGDVVRITDETYLDLLAQALNTAQRNQEITLSQAGLSVASAARFLITATRGADTDAKTEAEHRAHIKRVVHVLLCATRSR